MHLRAKTIAQNVGNQILEGGKKTAKELVKLTDPSAANYKVSTAASMLFLSIYELAPEDANAASALALIGFAGSAVMAVRQSGIVSSIYQTMSKGLQYGANNMLTIFKPQPQPEAKVTENPSETVEQTVKKTL